MSTCLNSRCGIIIKTPVRLNNSPPRRHDARSLDSLSDRITVTQLRSEVEKLKESIQLSNVPEPIAASKSGDSGVSGSAGPSNPTVV
jgi:hypothetical protein